MGDIRGWVIIEKPGKAKKGRPSWMRGRALRRRWQKLQRSGGRAVAITGLMAILTVLLGCIATYEYLMPPNIPPTAYTPLLNTIAKGESGGNYNAYFGHAGNIAVRFTDMLISGVLQWQNDYVHAGSPSSAVGKYQIIRPTLAGLVERLKIDPAAKFDEQMQDKLAIALLEKRGSEDYAKNKLTSQQFAANLAKEWAALPKAAGTNPGQSYYADDGINKVRISLDEIYQAMATLKR